MSTNKPNETKIDIIADDIYKHFKKKRTKYDEAKHCKMLIKVMLDPKRGSWTSFCVEAKIGDRTFHEWIDSNELFRDLYAYCKMLAKELWYEEGYEIRNKEYPLGTINYEFEHWKMIGWERFGISKNPRVKLRLKPSDNPAQHYVQLLQQASEGAFTASEFKQLMEAINVGLNAHQVCELQKQIDELKSDLNIMAVNSNGYNSIPNKGIEKTN